VKSFENEKADPVTVFFAFSLGSLNPKRHLSRINILPKFTSVQDLEPKNMLVLDVPMAIYVRQNFWLCYAELGKHRLRVDMWETSRFTFNSYAGKKERNLQKIAKESSSITWLLGNVGGKGNFDVALVETTVCFEEVFDFELICENWNLDMYEETCKALKKQEWLDQRKRLTFVMPTQRLSQPLKGSRVKSYTTRWNKDSGKFIWPASTWKCTTTFTGTRTNLSSSYFIVHVGHGNPPEFVLSRDSEPAEKMTMSTCIGKSLMCLTSILRVSVFKGIVKRKPADETTYCIGDVSGNVRLIEKSKNMKFPEFSIKGGRPAQPVTGGGAITSLNRNERYLVVRVLKCENLPIADIDEGSSDPFLKAPALHYVCVWRLV
jgi:centrosomal protein CEP76